MPYPNHWLSRDHVEKAGVLEVTGIHGIRGRPAALACLGSTLSLTFRHMFERAGGGEFGLFT